MDNLISQNRWVKYQLRLKGFVTRNEALRNGITRLSARIYDLRLEGMEIKTARLNLGKGAYDYKYYLAD